jgi:hypothetical protein
MYTIQLLFYTCWLNSPKANYKVNTSEQTKQTHAHTRKQNKAKFIV